MFLTGYLAFPSRHRARWPNEHFGRNAERCMQPTNRVRLLLHTHIACAVGTSYPSQLNFAASMRLPPFDLQGATGTSQSDDPRAIAAFVVYCCGFDCLSTSS